MPNRFLAASALTAAVLALTLAQAPAQAQTAATTDSGSGSGSGSAVTTPGAAMNANTPAARNAAAHASSVVRTDQKAMRDIAQANMAEIASAKLALDKSQNDQVKSFAQKMIDDHTKALTEVQQLAQSKGVELPDGPDLKHKAMATAMEAMSGDTFDRDYIKNAGLKDHRATLDLLHKTQRNAKDAGLKALATKMVPVVQGHLKMAEQMSRQAMARQ